MDSSGAISECAVRNFPNGVIVVFDATLTYRLVGPDVLPFSGRQASEMVGKTIYELFGDETAAELEPELRATLAGESRSFDVEFEGLVHHIETRPMAVEGDPHGVLVTQNVTAERHTTEELEILNRILRHDVRNDMSVLLGWAELLEAHLDEEGRSHLRRILNSGEHILALTSTARDVVEMLVSGEEMRLEPTSLESTLGVEVALRQESFPHAEFRVDEGCRDFDVLANELLASVFRNLLNNAVQHNDAERPVVDISCERDGDAVVVRIADNGPGIPEARRAAIADGERPTLDSSGGGMGLYLVHRLVARYGGDVRIEDNDPEGAVVAVRLALADAPACD
ncbi:MAG: ATP-binding protein [Halobellus sp.]